MTIEGNLEQQWENLLSNIQTILGKKPTDLNAVLFLIGIQELGKGAKNFSKEEKQDLMHIATCRLLSYIGIYEHEGTDQEGWPHWKLIKPLPFISLVEQEKLLKEFAILYFNEEVLT